MSKPRFRTSFEGVVEPGNFIPLPEITTGIETVDGLKTLGDPGTPHKQDQKAKECDMGSHVVVPWEISISSIKNIIFSWP
jgi:hypothetical protein